MLKSPAVEIELIKESRIAQVDFNNIPFGKTFSDHMLVASYHEGRWQSARIQPYGPLMLSPATSALHYGQAIFEGMKAHRTADGRIALFRPDQNFLRFNRSAVRMSMPEVPESIFMGGLRELIRLDRAWIPEKDNASLYIRPLLFATEPFIGVKTSDSYLFLLMIGPAGPYYEQAVPVMVNEDYARAVKGGVGYVKTAGNYGRTLYVVEQARAKGYKDVLWLDGQHREYVEEIGTMNVFFVIDGTLVTPAKDGTFLEGITRDSVLQIAADLGIPTEERKVSIHELVRTHGEGKLQEMFGTGTAATINAISSFFFRGEDYHLQPEAYTISSRLKQELEGIKHNTVPDRHGWLEFIS